MAVNAGVLVASLIGFTLSSWLAPVEMASWGWRIGFGVAGLLGLIVLWLRLAVAETSAFEASKAPGGRGPLARMFMQHPKAALRVIGIAMAGNLLNYLWLVHFPTYVHVKTGLPLKDALSASMISVAVSLFLIPAFGALSDRIGRRPVLMLFAAGSALFVGPGLGLLSDHFWLDALIATIGMALVSLFSGTVAAVMAEQFPAEVRATGVSFPYAVSVTLFGGTAPWIVTTMTQAGIGHLVWVYVAAICAIGFGVYALMPETNRNALD
jgi:MHS family alpha-ketoglutarate permease-like MFS transporter